MLDLVNNVDVIDLKTSNEIIKCIKDVTNITDEEKKKYYYYFRYKIL